MRATLVILVILIAGCSSPDSAPPSPSSPDSPSGDPLPEEPAGTTRAFTSATRLSHELPAGEPRIAIDREGQIFVAALAGCHGSQNVQESRAYLWRSRDGGASWETIRAPVKSSEVGAFCSGDVDVTTSPDGDTYASDWWMAGPGAPLASNFVVEHSANGGDTWTSTPVTTPRLLAGGLSTPAGFYGSYIDRQWLLAGHDGFVGLFYGYAQRADGIDPGPHEAATGAALRIEAVFSADRAATWSAPVTVVDGRDTAGLQAGRPVLARGSIILPYGTSGTGSYFGGPASVHVARSRDAGASWDSEKVADVPEGFQQAIALQAAVDEVGREYVVWASRASDTMQIEISRRDPDATAWTSPLVIAAGGLDLLPWVDARGDGELAVSWYHADALGDPMEVADSVAWTPRVVESIDAGRTFQRISSDASPIAQGPVCVRGSTCLAHRELLDFQSLAYAPDGSLHHTYTAIRGGATIEHAWSPGTRVANASTS